jgi:hypothetical protein
VRPRIPYRLKFEIGGLYDWGVRIGTQKIKLTAMQKASMEAAIGNAILDPSPFSPLRMMTTTSKTGPCLSERDRFEAPSAPVSLSGHGFKHGRATGFHLTGGSSIIWSANHHQSP